MYQSIKRGIIASLTGAAMVVSGFVAPAQAANNYLIDCAATPGPEYTNTSSDENFYGNWDVYLGGTQTEVINVTIQNCNIHLARDNSGYFYNDYSGTLEPVAYELTVTPGGMGEARGYNAGFGEPAFITLIINFYNSVDPNYVEPAFSIKDGNGNDITSITGNTGVALNESYDVVLVGEGWSFGEPGKGWGYSLSSRPNSGVNYGLTLNGAFGEPQSFTLTVTGTPTQGYYREQSLMITDDNGQTFTYNFSLAINGEGTEIIETDPSNFGYGEPTLPNKTDLFAGSSLPALYAVNPSDDSRIELVPVDGWDKLVTESNGTTDFYFVTDELFVDETYGSIRANVRISLDSSGYEYTVDTWSWDWEGTPVPVAIELITTLKSGAGTQVANITENERVGILDSNHGQPFVVLDIDGDNTPSTITEVDGVFTVIGNPSETTMFRLTIFDYVGCPTIEEMVNAYDFLGTLETTGYVSENECVFPESESFAGANIKFDEAIVYVGEPGMANQISGTDDIGRAASVGDFIDYLNVTTVNGVVYNAILTVDNVVGGYYDFPGDNIVAKIDDHTSTTEENPRIRTRFAYDAGDGDRYVEYTLYFYVANDESKSPVTVSDLMLNVYDIDWYQFMELNNVSSYILSEGSELTATNTDGIWRFEDANGNDSDSTDESRVQANLNAFSTLTVRLGISAGDTSDASASYQLDFSSGTEWIIPQAEPKTNEYDPNNPEPQPEPEPEPQPQPEPAPAPAGPSMQVDPVTPPTVDGKTGFTTGEKVNLTGKVLEGLTKVMVGGVEVTFTNNTSTGLEFNIPELPEGTYDITLIGPNGTLTYQSAIKIVARVSAVTSDTASKLFSGFAPNSHKMTEQMKREIRLWLKKHPNITMVDITGLTQGPTVLKTDPKLARNRAIVVKAFIKKELPNVTFAKTKIKNTKVNHKKYRGATIKITYSK